MVMLEGIVVMLEGSQLIGPVDGDAEGDHGGDAGGIAVYRTCGW